MIEKLKFSKNIIYNNNFLKIISLLAAILFWFIVVINVSPDYKRTITGVPVTVNENATSLSSLGLHVVDKTVSAVSVTVSGPRYIIGRLNPDDFTVSPNLADITKMGTYSLELGASLNLPDNRIRITNISTNYVSIHFDTVMTKTLPITVKVQDNKVPDGYLMQTATANPANITVKGPTTEISKVNQAVVNININGNTTKTASDKCSVELLDTSGKKLDIDHMQLSCQSAQVTVPILKVVSLPLVVGFTNVPAGFNTTNISFSIDPKTLTVAGEESQIGAISQISLGDIDFSTLDITGTQQINIPDLSGLMNVGNVSSANVSVTLNNTASSTLNTNTFSVINVPTGYTVTVKTKQISGIKLLGPANGISNVKSVTAVIDMGKMQNGTGQYQMPVSFEVPGKTGYWVKGSYTAVVDVVKS